jgi:hypothetical protein
MFMILIFGVIFAALGGSSITIIYGAKFRFDFGNPGGRGILNDVSPQRGKPLEAGEFAEEVPVTIEHKAVEAAGGVIRRVRKRAITGSCTVLYTNNSTLRATPNRILACSAQ